MNSAYVVLEHASKGDLHRCLLNAGKLPHKMIRFVVGEIATALAVIHEYGFCYNDLKPENVLITELGHIKVMSC
jgi:serine/threonine protein kinase